MTKDYECRHCGSVLNEDGMCQHNECDDFRRKMTDRFGTWYLTSNFANSEDSK